MAENKRMMRNLNEGSVGKVLVSFAMPLFLSNLLQAVYNIVDMVVAGQVLGSSGMSGVSIGGDVLHLLTFIAMGFSGAGQVVISQYVGAGLRDKIKKTIGTLFTFLFLVSVGLMLLTFIFRNQLLAFLKTPDESYQAAMDYTMVCASGLVFIYGYNVVSAILRGMGDSRRPFVFISIAAILNTILDILFVKYMGMGTMGAALATVIGQAVSFIASLIYLYKNKEQFGFDFRFSSFRIDAEVFRPLFKLGIPMTIQSAAVMFSKLFVVRWVNSFGVNYSAMTGAANKIKMAMMLGSNAFMTAASTMMGQAIGAENYDRVKKIFWTATTIISSIGVVLGSLIFLFPDVAVGLFTQDPAVLSLAHVWAPIILVDAVGMILRAPSFALINGSGNSRLNLMVALFDGIIARLSFAYVLGFTMGLGCFGVWLGDALAGFVPGLIGYPYFFSGRWRTREHLLGKMK
jgi:putative MATE family efflux protein